AEAAHIGLLCARLAAFLLLRCRAARRPGRTRRRLARALYEPSRRCGRSRCTASTASTASTTSTTSTEPESLREALQITGEQGRLKGPEHLRIGARLLERVEYHLDAARDQRAVAPLRGRQWLGGRQPALEAPGHTVQPRAARAVHSSHRVAAH